MRGSGKGHRSVIMKPNIWIAALAFFSVLIFGSGVALHRMSPSPAPAASTAPAKGTSQGHHAKGKPSPKEVIPKEDAPKEAGNAALAFPLMLAGAAGLLLSALSGIVSIHSILNSQPEAARRLRAAELALRQKQQSEFEAQQAALQSQLQEAKQRKAETEALRDQVSRQFQEFFRTLPVPCFCFAANGRIIRWNAACEALYGIPAATALESTLWDTIVPATERETTEEKLTRVLSGESLLADERRDTVAGGEVAPLRCSMVPLYDAEGTIIGGLSAGVNITDFTHQQTQIAVLAAERDAALRAAEDAVTALAPLEKPEESAASFISSASSESSRQEITGQSEFQTRLEKEIARAARYHSPLSLVLLDLDGFAARNQALGAEAGDQARQNAVTVMKSKIRTVDVLARLGEGEYAVILPETGEAGARVAADRLRTGLAGTSPAGQPPLTACFGVTQLTPDVSGSDSLVIRAQEALQTARSCGANTVMHYQDMAASKPPKPASRTAARSRSTRKVEA